MPRNTSTDLPLSPDRLADGLRAQTDAFAAAVQGVDPRTRVPTCPRWRLRDLVGHIGQEHRWAAGIVRTGAAAPVPDPKQADPGAPTRWGEWLRAGAEELIAAVTDAGAATPVWTVLGPKPAVFWLRRSLADTSVHHADAALTSGAAFRIAPDLAADAVDEWLTLLSDPAAPTVKPDVALLRGDGQTLRLEPPSGPGWLVTRTPSGVRVQRAGGRADVTVAGPVADLLLVLTRRVPPDRATVTGDRALVEHWLAHTAL
ncbi:maleylpyruvate isomerase family mycothiol-dependent enzyme [Pseudonocardia acaciae]|uniref:maleylpyruvate isomerase family mycothiol-dependent enzyme n=1 Tax=Pseudonocardia acaciae TaxID=551276 RepID=UPI001FDEEA21|nr:maleylpyruvate isomerase family mycothiol-dependent enzyme [Pseudonocardia acaciae]